MSSHHAETCSALADSLHAATHTYRCACGAVEYAKCIVCETCVTRERAPDAFATTGAGEYRIVCGVCRDVYCNACGNLALTHRAPVGGAWLCRECGVTYAQAECVVRQYTVAFNVTQYDRNERVQNRVTNVPLAFASAAEAQSGARHYLALVLRASLPTHTLEELIERVDAAFEPDSDANAASPLLAQRVYVVAHEPANAPRSEHVRCVISINPIRTALVS